MTVAHRLYYTDSYTTSFNANVIERIKVGTNPALVLNQTYFYPTSGGQPHDTGTLSGVRVLDVLVRESDGAVLHIMADNVPGEQLTGQIDWERRFDHMQHHTGQHILSQAFMCLANAATVGFHLSPDSVTIDLDTSDLEPSVIDAAETLANQVVTENRSVRAWFPGEDELGTLQLRKVPDVDGKLRVVDIADFDLNACGGTHVAHTGEIGLIKILRIERRGDTVRVEFCCGGRALRDYQHKHRVLSQLATELTTAYTEVPAILEKLRAENKALNREVRTWRATALESEAEALWRGADRSGGYALVTLGSDDREVDEMRQLVQHLISHPATVALCGTSGQKAQLICARSEDLTIDMVPVLMQGLAVWGVERGGGRPSFAQGGGTAADLAEVNAALGAAAKAVQAASTSGVDDN